MQIAIQMSLDEVLENNMKELFLEREEQQHRNVLGLVILSI